MRTGSWPRSRTPSPEPDAPDGADRMLRLLGYTDRLSVAPGETIRFMVSSDHDRYASRLVRLIHGDTNPAGPGFKQVLVPSAIDGVRPGRTPGPAERLLGDPARCRPASSMPTSRSRSSSSRRHQADASRSSRVVAARSTVMAGRWSSRTQGRSRPSSGAAGRQDRIATGIRVAALGLVLRGADDGGRRGDAQPPPLARSRCRTGARQPPARRPMVVPSSTTPTPWCSRHRSTAIGGRGTSTAGSTGRG